MNYFFIGPLVICIENNSYYILKSNGSRSLEINIKDKNYKKISKKSKKIVKK